MADYTAAFRTSYFHVTDEQALRDLASTVGVELLQDQTDPTLFALGDYSSVGELVTENPDTEGDQYISVIDEVQKLLPDGEVAVFMEAGHEKLRYVSGYCWVLTNKELRFHDTTLWAREQATLLGKENIKLAY